MQGMIIIRHIVNNKPLSENSPSLFTLRPVFFNSRRRQLAPTQRVGLNGAKTQHCQGANFSVGAKIHLKNCPLVAMYSVFSYVCRNAKDLVEGERDVHFCFGHSLTNVELLGFMLLLDSTTISETMYICMYFLLFL
jgi:hypothetical protein